MKKKITCLFCNIEVVEKGHITKCEFCGGDLHNRENVSECACCGKRFPTPETKVNFTSQADEEIVMPTAGKDAVSEVASVGASDTP